MKKIFILIGAACISLTATAQTTMTLTRVSSLNDEIKAGLNKNKGFVINPGLSSGVAGILTDNSAIEDNIKPILSLQPGINIGYMLNAHVGFFTGLAYSTNGYRIDDQTSKYTAKLHFIDIPVFVRLITSKADKVGFIVDLGMATGFLASAKTKLETGSASLTTTSKDGFSKTAFSAAFFIGVKIPVNPKVNILAGFDSQLILNDVNNPKGSSRVQANRGGLKVSAAIKLSNN